MSEKLYPLSSQCSCYWHSITTTTHSPQASGSLCLVDVDEVGHHAALEQTALRLHSDLEQIQTHKRSSNTLGFLP